jgi:hypothetical protein
MPYIKKEERVEMDKVVDFMIEHGVKADGKLNYVLFKFCKNTLYDTQKESYNEYKNFLGELNECAEEIRRRLLSLYENKKITENGDVY